MPPKKHHLECQLQCFFITQFNKYVDPKTAIIAHVPNGMQSDAKGGSILNKMGVHAGFPDIIILSSLGVTLVELKTIKRTSKLSPEQTHFRKTAFHLGYRVIVTRTKQDLLDIVHFFYHHSMKESGRLDREYKGTPNLADHKSYHNDVTPFSPNIDLNL